MQIRTPDQIVGTSRDPGTQGVSPVPEAEPRSTLGSQGVGRGPGPDHESIGTRKVPKVWVDPGPGSEPDPAYLPQALARSLMEPLIRPGFWLRPRIPKCTARRPLLCAASDDPLERRHTQVTWTRFTLDNSILKYQVRMTNRVALTHSALHWAFRSTQDQPDQPVCSARKDTHTYTHTHTHTHTHTKEQEQFTCTHIRSTWDTLCSNRKAQTHTNDSTTHTLSLSLSSLSLSLSLSLSHTHTHIQGRYINDRNAQSRSA